MKMDVHKFIRHSVGRLASGLHYVCQELSIIILRMFYAGKVYCFCLKAALLSTIFEVILPCASLVRVRVKFTFANERSYLII